MNEMEMFGVANDHDLTIVRLQLIAVLPTNALNLICVQLLTKQENVVDFLHKTPFIMIPIDYYWFGTNHSALQCYLKLLNGSYSAVNGLPYLTERTVELGYAQYKVIHDSARTRLMNFFDTRPIRFLPLCYTYSGCITSFGMTNRNQSTRYIQIGNRKREKFLVINWFRAWKLWKIATCIT